MGKREIRTAQREKKRRMKIVWGGIMLAVLAIAGFIGWSVLRPSLGETIPIMANAGEHVEVGSDPGPFNSNPPTSGRHYGQEYDAGFYDENSSEAQADYPEGYLGHNLEHGYVIFWYNCALLDDAGCETLKTQVQGVMDKYDNFKVIAFPTDSTDVPLAIVSWGQLLELEEFDANSASQFVKVNRNRAPEPNAP
jgi:hypothetical protein